MAETLFGGALGGIAVRSHESETWKSVIATRDELGPGDHGTVSVFLASLIVEEGLYRELGEALRRHGATIVAARVEKPFVGKPSSTRSEAWLLEQGVGADEWVPLDGIVSLVLSR